MQKKIYAGLMILSVILVSILIMIIPTFFTNGISRISLNKEINLPLILNDTKDIKLVFFGYSGCSDICTPRLYSISEVYNDLDKESQKRVGVEFLDISVPSDYTLPSRFAQYFNPDFKGIFLNEKVLREYTRAFDVYFSQSLSDAMEYDHTANLYLVKKTNNTKELRYVYSSYPYDLQQINLDIKELLNE